jgi:hypothetical protein
MSPRSLGLHTPYYLACLDLTMASQSPGKYCHVKNWKNYEKLKENPCRVIFVWFRGSHSVLRRFAARVLGDLQGDATCTVREPFSVSPMIPLTHEAEIPLRFMSPSKE